MLRLGACIFSHLFSPASTYLRLPLLLSATAAPPISPHPGFVVEDYLVATCGLTRPQALKASRKLSHLKSPSKPDAVLAFLRGLGVSDAGIAALVAKDPKFLCARVERTLAPRVAALIPLGLSRGEIARLIPLAHISFRCKPIATKLHYYIPLLGSSENLHRVLKHSMSILAFDLERVVKPNVALLRECGLSDCDIAKTCAHSPRLLISKRVREKVAYTEGLGVPRGSAMFRHALGVVASFSEETISTKMGYLKTMFGWSDAEVAIAVSKFPAVLNRAKGRLQRISEFLISEVGLEPAYIARYPQLVNYSMERRLRPRSYVVKFLKENGLLGHDWSYCTVFKVSDETFMEKFIRPRKDAVPGLAEDFTSACRGEVPTRFRFS